MRMKNVDIVFSWYGIGKEKKAFAFSTSVCFFLFQGFPAFTMFALSWLLFLSSSLFSSPVNSTLFFWILELFLSLPPLFSLLTDVVQLICVLSSVIYIVIHFVKWPNVAFLRFTHFLVVAPTGKSKVNHL